MSKISKYQKQLRDHGPSDGKGWGAGDRFPSCVSLIFFTIKLGAGHFAKFIYIGLDEKKAKKYYR